MLCTIINFCLFKSGKIPLEYSSASYSANSVTQHRSSFQWHGPHFFVCWPLYFSICLTISVQPVQLYTPYPLWNRIAWMTMKMWEQAMQPIRPLSLPFNGGRLQTRSEHVCVCLRKHVHVRDCGTSHWCDLCYSEWESNRIYVSQHAYKYRPIPRQTLTPWPLPRVSSHWTPNTVSHRREGWTQQWFRCRHH